MNKDSYFILFANCIPVKGAARSIICDIQRSTYIFIPNSLYLLAQYFRTDRFYDLLKRFPELSEDILLEYTEYLIEHEMGFFCDDPQQFPEIPVGYRTPYLLNDCIIELSKENLLHTSEIINGLQITGCQNVELRSYNYFDTDSLFSFIDRLSETRVRNVIVYNAFSEIEDKAQLNKYISEYQIVSHYFIHSAPLNEVWGFNNRIITIEEELNSSNCCGNISSDYFAINLPFFMEAQEYNSCLNRKISIDSVGNIKNCPSLHSTFGHIGTTDLSKVLENANFRAVWNINKDQINICKDCEFRYICSDCRAFLSNHYDKPAKCSYNPYTNTYENNIK